MTHAPIARVAAAAVAVAALTAGVPALARTPDGPVPLRLDRPLAVEDRRPRAETAVGVDPRDPSHVAVAAIQFTQGLPGALISGYQPDDHVWSSSRGGLGYRDLGDLPPLRSATPRSDDPSLAWDRSGRLYASYTSYLSDRQPQSQEEGVYVARSEDNGRHWRRLAHLDGFSCSGPERSIVTTDPRTGWLYVTWTSHQDTPGCSSRDGTVTVLRWARSTDGGAHFSAPVAVTAPGEGLYPAPAVLPDGTLLVSYLTPGVSLYDDACQGISQVVNVRRFAPTGRLLGESTALPSVCAAYGGLFGNGAAYLPRVYPAIAVDATGGRGVMVAAATQGSSTGGIATAGSLDGGRTWTQRFVAGEPGTSGTMAALASGPKHRFALAWLEVGAGGVYRPLLNAALGAGEEWSGGTPLASASSSGNSHPQSGADLYGLGDYLGVSIGSDSVAHVAWPDLRARGTDTAAVDVWTRDLRMP